MHQPSTRRTTRSGKGNDHKGKAVARPKQSDQDEVCLNSLQTLRWRALNRHAEELERHIDENKTKKCEERLVELEQQQKRSIDLNDIIKNIEDQHLQRLRQLDIRRQRRLEQIEDDYTKDCEALEEKYQLAQQKLSMAWKELYPAGKRRKAYPESIKELLDRYDPPEESFDDDEIEGNIPNLIQELIDRVDPSSNESEKDHRYRLYRVLTRKNEDEIKDNLAQMYYDPDDTPEPTDVLRSRFAGSSSPSPKASRTASPSL